MSFADNTSTGIPQVSNNKLSQNTWILLVVVGLVVLIVTPYLYKKLSPSDIVETLSDTIKPYSTGIESLRLKEGRHRYTPVENRQVPNNNGNAYIDINNGKLEDLVRFGCGGGEMVAITMECMQMVINSIQRNNNKPKNSRNDNDNDSDINVSNNSNSLLSSETENEKWARRAQRANYYERNIKTVKAPLNNDYSDGMDDLTGIESQINALYGQVNPESIVDGLLNNGVATGNQNDEFAKKHADKLVRVVEALPSGQLNYTIRQGKIIKATIENAVDSTLPGMIRGITSHDIYGESGDLALIPRGSRLIGFYNSSIRNGQNRMFIVWTRLIRPDGIDILIDSTGQDSLGKSGSAADLDSHFWQRFGTASLLSVIGAGVSSINVSPSDFSNSTDAYRQSIANSFQRSAGDSLQNNISIPDTLSINQGNVVQIMVKHDLNFYNALKTVYGDE